MSSSVATIMNAVADELGLPRPPAWVAGSDIATRQMMAHFNAAGDTLAAEFDWSELMHQGVITTISGTASYALPADFDSFVDETMWDVASRARVYGPRNQRDWAQVEGAGVNIGPYFAQQTRSDFGEVPPKLRLQPTPTVNGHVIAFYYISGWWVLTLASGGAGGIPLGPRPISDTNGTVWNDDRMMICAVKYRWLRSKGLDYSEEKDEYESRLIKLIGVNRGSKTMSMDPADSAGYGQTGFVIPISGFGQ